MANIVLNTHFLALLLKIIKTTVSYGTTTVVQNGNSSAATAGNLSARGVYVCMYVCMYVIHARIVYVSLKVYVFMYVQYVATIGTYIHMYVECECTFTTYVCMYV